MERETGMTIEVLTIPEIRDVYHHQLEADFPPDERKPLSRIEAMTKQGRYICYGMKDGTGILAYAFFAVMENQFLFDYLAVREERRGTGIGSSFLQALCNGQLKNASCVLLEVEDPAAAASPEEKAARDRRIRFYMKNGLRNTGAKVNTFGVDFLILELPAGRTHNAEEAGQIYSLIYRSILPARLYRRMIHIEKKKKDANET